MHPRHLESAVAWELRTAWATQREVVVLVDADLTRVRGYVEHVAASDAFTVVWDGRELVHVPIALVSAVRRPHFTMEDAPVQPRKREPAIVLDGQLEFEISV